MRVLTRKEFQDDMAKEWSEAVEAEYKAQIEAAVLEEREACAKLCETKHFSSPVREFGAKECAIAIRARGQA